VVLTFLSKYMFISQHKKYGTKIKDSTKMQGLQVPFSTHFTLPEL